MGEWGWEGCMGERVEGLNGEYMVVKWGGGMFGEFWKREGGMMGEEKEVMEIVEELGWDMKVIGVEMDGMEDWERRGGIVGNEGRDEEGEMRGVIMGEEGERVVL